VVYIQKDEVNSHIQSGTWREKPTSVFHQQKNANAKRKKSWASSMKTSLAGSAMDILWEVKSVSFRPKKSPFIQTFLTCDSLKCDSITVCVCLLFWIINYRAGPHQSPRISHTYSLRSHIAQRGIDDEICVCCFFSFYFYPSALECDGVRFLNPLRWKLHFRHIPKNSYSRVFEDKCEKNRPKSLGTKIGRKVRIR
jgi:hypothetical protein